MMKLLRTSKITDFQDTSMRIHKNILGFDIAVGKVLSMHVTNAAANLVAIQLHKESRKPMLQTSKGLKDLIKSFREIFHHKIQVNSRALWGTWGQSMVYEQKKGARES